MKREEKKQVVEQLRKEFQEAKSTILVNYQGLNVAEITDLRRKLHEGSIDFKVIKNTLAIIAAQGTSVEKAQKFFDGPTAAVISKNDPVSSIKILDNFAKENPKLVLKVGLVEGALFDRQSLPKLATLPSRPQLMGMLLGTMQAPLATFVRMMAATPSGLLNVLNGIKNSKSE